MRKLFIAALTAPIFGLSQIALAADLPRKAPPLPPAPVYSWTGWYVGLNAGWVGSANDGNISNSATDTGNNGLGFALIAGSIPTTVHQGKLSGFIGGGQIGYNWQRTNWLWGLEADFQGVALSSKDSNFSILAGGLNTITSTFSRDLNWLATFRGRLGWLSTPQFLLYATGGLAVGDPKVSNSVSGFFPAFSGTSESSKTQAGWTVGGGVEWMFAPRWSLKAEYLYVDFGHNDTTLSQSYPVSNNATLTSRVTDTFHVVRGGINFHF